MIKIEGRSLEIPTQERIIGWVGDNRVEVRIFELSRHYGDTDLAGFDFKLDTQSGDVKNIIDLDKTVADDKITLTWTVKESHILNPGYMSLQIRAFSAGEEKWYSAQDYVKVQPSINAEQSIPDPLPSEFEQMEARVTVMRNEAVGAASVATEQANRALGIADTFENETLPAAIQAVQDAGQEKVDEAAQQVDRVQGIIDEAEQEILPELRQAIEDGGLVKTALDGSIETAGTAKTQLDSSIASAGTAKTQLEGTITQASNAKGQVDDSVSQAGTVKTELDGSIATAGQVKNALDESIQTGDLATFKAEFQSHKNDFASYRDNNNLKISKVEKELSDYKSVIAGLNPNQEVKQKVEGYGVVSLPKNAAEGQVSVVLRGRTLTNENIRKSSNAFWMEDTLRLGFLNTLKHLSGLVTLFNNDDRLIIIDINDRETDSFKRIVSKPVNQKSVLITLASDEYIVRINGKEKDGWADTSEDKEKLAESVVIKGDLTEETLHYFDGTKSTVSAMRLKSVGKNLFDKNATGNTWGSGYNKVDSTDVSSNVDWVITDFIKVKGDTKYYKSGNDGGGIVNMFDSNKNIILGGSSVVNGAFTTPPNASYIRTNTRMVSLNTLLIAEGTTATPYEPYTESTQYITVKDSEGKIAELRSLPNGVKDEIRVAEGKLIKRIKSMILKDSDFEDILSGLNNVDLLRTKVFSDNTPWTNNIEGKVSVEGLTESAYSYALDGILDDTANIGKFATSAVERLYFVVPKGTSFEDAKSQYMGTPLIYQLATPVETPIQVSGTLLSNPSGTVYVEPFVADAGVYSDRISVLHEGLPIKAVEKISKVAFDTGLETELDITAAVIAEDKLSFTHPDLTSGDIVFFVYEHGAESTIPETEISYYDSRYVIKGEDDKFYQWEIEAKLVEGVITPSIKLVEV